jgi:hypothetical protein
MRRLIRQGSRSPAQVTRMIREACLLLCLTFGLFLAAAGQRGWLNGASVHAMAGLLLAFQPAVAAYWVIGERLLTAALERRAADKQALGQDC